MYIKRRMNDDNIYGMVAMERWGEQEINANMLKYMSKKEYYRYYRGDQNYTPYYETDYDINGIGAVFLSKSWDVVRVLDIISCSEDDGCLILTRRTGWVKSEDDSGYSEDDELEDKMEEDQDEDDMEDKMEDEPSTIILTVTNKKIRSNLRNKYDSIEVVRVDE